VRYYGGDTAEEFKDVYATEDGGYVMCGTYRPPRDSIQVYDDFWIVRVDREGQLIWQRHIDVLASQRADRAFSIIETDDGGFLVGGSAEDEEPYVHFTAIKVNSEGEFLWRYTHREPPRASQCKAVIETKAGNYLLGGQLLYGRPSIGYLVKVDTDGEVIWERRYQHEQLSYISAIRESPGNGFLLAGVADGARFSLLNVDENGDVVWAREYEPGGCTSLVSVNQGFALAGSHTEPQFERVNFRLIRVNRDGEQIGDREYISGREDRCWSIARMWDNGFTLIGTAWAERAANAYVIRTNPEGNINWEQTFNYHAFTSVIEDQEDFIIISGGTIDPEEDLGMQGLLVKVRPERSPPRIISHIPEDLDFTTLLGSSTVFAVYAVDLQDDDLSYLWTLDEEEIETDTTVTILFDVLGDHAVQCVVSDGDGAASVEWSVHVREFFIDTHLPDTLELTVRRRTVVDFSLDVSAIEGVEPVYSWIHTGRDQRQNQIGEAETVEFTFNLSGDQRIAGEVRHEDILDSRIWDVHVRSSVYSWWPSELELSAYVDSTLEFVITPFNENSDSLEYLWVLDDDQLGSDSASVLVTFTETGQSEITSKVNDGIEADTIQWTVNVEEWSFTANDADYADLPATPVLYPASPNPFNSVVKLSMYLPKAGLVSLSVFDINGREISRLVDGNVGAGNQAFVWSASDFPAGVYVVRMDVGDVSGIRKVVSVK